MTTLRKTYVCFEQGDVAFIQSYQKKIKNRNMTSLFQPAVSIDCYNTGHHVKNKKHFYLFTINTLFLIKNKKWAIIGTT